MSSIPSFQLCPSSFPSSLITQVSYLTYYVNFQDAFCKFYLMSWLQIPHHFLDSATEHITRYPWAEH